MVDELFLDKLKNILMLTFCPFAFMDDFPVDFIVLNKLYKYYLLILLQYTLSFSYI